MENFWNLYIVPWGLNILLALAIFLVGRWIAKQVSKLATGVMRRAGLDAMLINFVASILNVLLLLFIIVAALSRLGVDTTSLIALVGAAGLAIGLALQDSLKSFAAGVLLIVFRPFREGDFVEVAGTSGIVEQITIFNTVLRTGDNREITVPNGSIYSNVIVNFSRRPTRRIDMVFGIGYEDDLRKAKTILNEVLAADERVLKDPAPVVAVSELGDSSVNFVVRPWVNSADYWVVRWDLIEAVKLRFDEEGISIPFPQMDIHHYRHEASE